MVRHLQKHVRVGLQAEILAGTHPAWCRCLQLGQLSMALPIVSGDLINRANGVTLTVCILRMRQIAPDSFDALV